MSDSKEQDRDGAVGEEVPAEPMVPDSEPLNWALALVKQSLLADYEWLKMQYGFQIPPHAHLSQEEISLLGHVDDGSAPVAKRVGRRRAAHGRRILELKALHERRRSATPSPDGLDKLTRKL